MIDIAGFTDGQKAELNNFGNLFSYKHTSHSQAFLNADYDITFVSKGNQAGGTALIAYAYVLRILGWHPVPRKNVVYFECPKAIEYAQAQEAQEEGEDISDVPKGTYWSPKQYYSGMVGKPCPCCGGEITKHERIHKIYRFCSQNLPETKNNAGLEAKDSSSETKNTQYPEFCHWLPPFLLKKDITHRERVQYIYDIYGGKEILIEYVGYNQQTQSLAGHKRTGAWLDELAPEKFYDEQIPRLMYEDGDINISYTPTVDNAISYYFDRVYDRAKVYYKSPSMRNYYKEKQNLVYPEVEFTNSKESIAVIQMSTYDNPKLKLEVINKKASALGDEDPILKDMRIFGIFAAVTGKIYKQFMPRIHVISGNQYFPTGIPDGWAHFRSEDWHQATPLANTWVSLSPTDEMFIWEEMKMDPERNTTLAVCEAIAKISGTTKRYGMNMLLTHWLL